MFQMVYSSRARTNLLPVPELRSMLTDFRAHNARVGISGILLHSFGRFFQLIEGDKPDVDVLFARIERDPRHYDISHMDLRFPHRLFDGWSMAFVDMDSDEIAIPGFAGRPPSVDLHLIDETTAREMLLYFSDRLAVCV